VTDSSTVGTSVRQGGLIAKLRIGVQMDGGQKGVAQSVEVRSPITGRIRSLSAPSGTHVSAGAEVATVDPGDDRVWEALRALYLVGQLEDLPAIQAYERDSSQISDRVRQQAALTEKSIRERANAQP
jgi:pyruvate/2-oxoglutarate dehydrogenase complex dihydrolipoamide acyltransferase (E2) component